VEHLFEIKKKHNWLMPSGFPLFSVSRSREKENPENYATGKEATGVLPSTFTFGQTFSRGASLSEVGLVHSALYPLWVLCDI
jgi:hypothetical protein